MVPFLSIEEIARYSVLSDSAWISLFHKYFSVQERVQKVPYVIHLPNSHTKNICIITILHFHFSFVSSHFSKLVFQHFKRAISIYFFQVEHIISLHKSIHFHLTLWMPYAQTTIGRERGVLVCRLPFPVGITPERGEHEVPCGQRTDQASVEAENTHTKLEDGAVESEKQEVPRLQQSAQPGVSEVRLGSWWGRYGRGFQPGVLNFLNQV